MGGVRRGGGGKRSSAQGRGTATRLSDNGRQPAGAQRDRGSSANPARTGRGKNPVLYSARFRGDGPRDYRRGRIGLRGEVASEPGFDRSSAERARRQDIFSSRG